MFHGPDVVYLGDASCEFEKNVYSAHVGWNILYMFSEVLELEVKLEWARESGEDETHPDD